jgi:L-serine dehydratase
MQNSIKTGLRAKTRIPGPIDYTRKAKAILTAKNKALSKDTQKLLAYGIAVSETNASRGVVVTCPTCGSTGILPSVLRFAKEKFKLSNQQIIDALLVGGIIGNVIRTNGSISGAEGGCQAECGSACAMAAAAYSHILGLNNVKISFAAKFALEHHLGLTCDSVLGYVLVPCISRNGVMASRAVEAATLSALMDETKQMFNFDQMVAVMKQTGIDIPQQYKETSIGGLAEAYKKMPHRE